MYESEKVTYYHGFVLVDEIVIAVDSIEAVVPLTPGEKYKASVFLRSGSHVNIQMTPTEFFDQILAANDPEEV